MRWIKRILVGLILVALAFVILNSDFFGKNIRFALFRRYPVDPTTLVTDTNKPIAEADTLWIVSLDIKAPLQYVDQNNEDVFQAALQKGVVHFPGTAEPGQFGNAYFFGHSSDYPWSKGQYKTVFALLPRIADGAEIKITDHDGNLYTYIVKQHYVVAANDTSVLDQGGYTRHLLTLQTSYPVGTALKRYIVIAELDEAAQ